MTREQNYEGVERFVEERLYFLHGEISMLSQTGDDEDHAAGFRRLVDLIDERNKLSEWYYSN